MSRLPALATIRLPRYERWRWQIFIITWLAYAGFYLTRKSFPVAKIAMSARDGLGLDNETLGTIDGFFLTAYAIGQFFWGVCGDRFGPRRVLLVGLAGSVAAAFAFGASHLVGWFLVLSALQGIFQSSGWAPLSKNLACFFSQRERGTVMGMWCTNYALGGFLASVCAAKAGDVWGWRYAFYVPAGMLFVIFILFIFFQRDRPEDVGLPPVEEYHGEQTSAVTASVAQTAVAEREQSWKVVLEVLENPMVLILALVYFFMKPARYAILLWGPKYLSERLGTNMMKSGMLGALFELAGPISVLLAGVVSDKLFQGRRMPVSILCLIGLAGSLFALDKLPVSDWWLGACMFGMGLMLFAPDSLISGTAAIDFGTKRGAATASGLINGCGSIGAIVGGTIPGFFQQKWGWNGVFTFLAASVLLAAVVLLPRWNAVPAPKAPA